MNALVLDTETTSREAGREVIEAAWIVPQVAADLLGDTTHIRPPLTIASQFSARYKPSRPMTFGALAVHHILPSELEDCPPSNEFKLPDGVEYLIGHSIDFDHEAIGKPNGVKLICTLAMARNLWPLADSHSQSALLYMLLGATSETREQLRGAHGAAVDCANNLALLNLILKAKPDIESWADLYAFSEFARIPTHMPMGRNKGAPITELESSEIEWYLVRDFIDEYLRKAFEAELKRRHATRPVDEYDDEEATEEDGDY